MVVSLLKRERGGTVLQYSRASSKYTDAHTRTVRRYTQTG